MGVVSTLVALLLLQVAPSATSSSQGKTFAPKAAAPETPPDSGKYFLAPLRGQFGKEITAPGIAQAIKIARQKKAGTIVFHIDSLGGNVEDADAIAKVLTEARPHIKIVSVVTRAFSASIWITAHSDIVAFEQGGPVGAAVCYSIDPNKGNVEVDAKFNAGRAAMLAGAAEAHGQPGAIYRAMIVQDVELFAYDEANGKALLSNERLPGRTDLPRILDSKETVLALTADQAAKIGFGQIVSGPSDMGLAKLLSATHWDPVSPSSNGVAAVKFGADAIAFEIQKRTRAEDTLTKSLNNYKALKAEAARLASRAETVSPSYTPLYYRSDGSLTSESQARWRQVSDSAIGAWQDVLATLQSASDTQKQIIANVAEINRQHRKVAEVRRVEPGNDPATPPDFASDNITLDAAWKTAEDELADIRARRNRNRIER